MFAMPINNSPLIGTAADDIFPNVKGDLYRGDVSFLATARMLLHERLPKDENANIVFRRLDWDDISRRTKDDILEFIRGGYPTENVVYVVEVSCSSETERKGFASYLKDTKEISGMTAEPAVEAFFNQLMNSHVWIDFEKCNTLILVDRMSVAKWHAIASLTSRYFRKYFAEKPLTETEHDIPLSLTSEENSDKFKDLMREFSKQFDFRSAGIKASLHGFENRNVKHRLEALGDQIAEKRNQIENLNQRYTQAMRAKMQLEEEHAAISMGLREEKDEVMEYFLRNKNLVLDNVSDNGSITFYAATPFANWNPDIAESMIHNPQRADRVDMYFKGDRKVTTADRDLFFTALMVDRTIRVWMYGKFTIGYEADYVVHAHSSPEHPEEMEDACPNPHLNFHACMGGNQRAAIDAALCGDFTLAIEQCIGAVASVNLNETITSGPWMNDLLSDQHGRIFELSDGRRMKFSDVMKYLKEEKK